MGKLFTFSATQVRKRWAWALQKLGLQQCNFTMHALRHGGACRDAARKLRPMLDIQKRGRWRTTAVLMRYEKRGRLQSVLAKVPSVTLEFCEHAARVKGKMLREEQLPATLRIP